MAVATSITAVTIWQPSATLLARGLKAYETRSWWPRRKIIGRRIAIHAGTHETTTDEVSDGLASIICHEGLDLLDMPYGAVTATALLMAVHKTDDRRPLVSADEVTMGDWSPGRYAWELADVVEFAVPIPARGAQKVWDWAPGPGTCLVCGATDDRCPGGVVWADSSHRLCNESECRRLALAGGMVG